MTLTIKMQTKWRKVWLTNFALSANVAEACRAAGISRQAAYLARTQDPDFALLWDEAEQVALDHLEKNIWTWADEGDEPDKRAMAKWILERRSPKYRLTEHVEIESRNLNLNVEAKVDPESLKDSVRILIESGALKLEDILPTGHPALDATPRLSPETN